MNCPSCNFPDCGHPKCHWGSYSPLKECPCCAFDIAELDIAEDLKTYPTKLEWVYVVMVYHKDRKVNPHRGWTVESVFSNPKIAEKRRSDLEDVLGHGALVFPIQLDRVPSPPLIEGSGSLGSG